MSQPTLVFDVNETLLDLTALRASVSRVLDGNEETVSMWFASLLHYSLVESAYGEFHPFGEIGASVLIMLAKQKGIEITHKEAEKALQPILEAPPHADVVEGLELFRESGFRMAVLTNSARSAMEKQLDHAGISHFFDKKMSVQDIEVYKPNKRVYCWASRMLHARSTDCIFVAAHGWDVAGAKAAGMRTAFLSRPGQSLYPLAEKPDHIEKNLLQFAQKMTGNKPDSSA